MSLRNQSKYYKAISRPFVNVENNTIKTRVIPSQNVNISYNLRNYGNSPAKDIQLKTEFFSKIDDKFKRIFKEGEDTFFVYPNTSLETLKKDLTIKLNNASKTYLHIAITYKDMAGKEHNSLIISLYPYEGGFKLIKSIFD